MMTPAEFRAERLARNMCVNQFSYHLGLILKRDMPMPIDAILAWEQGVEAVPKKVESALLCKREGWMKLERLYVIGGDGGSIKVGRSILPEARCTQLKSDEQRKLEVLFQVFCADARVGERLAHKKLGAFRVSGEWFSTTPLEAIAAVQAAADEVNSAGAA
jgi:hypothetical protein